MTFLWEVSGHQTEGDNTGSDTWYLENVCPTVFTEPSGRPCDGWSRWRGDVGLAAGPGLNAYRLSVEWVPVGLSPAIVDDLVAGDDPSVRDRKRSEVYARWLDLARGDDFAGVQNYELLTYDGDGGRATIDRTPKPSAKTYAALVAAYRASERRRGHVTAARIRTTAQTNFAGGVGSDGSRS